MAGPKIISFVVNGILCDGGAYRQYGWGRFSPGLRHVNSASKNPIIAPGSTDMQAHAPAEADAQRVEVSSAIRLLRVYDRFLRTSEVIGNYRAGTVLDPEEGKNGGNLTACSHQKRSTKIHTRFITRCEAKPRFTGATPGVAGC